MLPLTLINAAAGHPLLIELKGGETYSGHLVNCDPFMNLVLRDVTCTSKDGTRFWRIAECYVRGNNIKFLKMPDEIIDVVQEDIAKRQAMANQQQSNRGGRGGFQGGRGGYSRGGGRGGSYDGARSGGPDGGRGGSRGGRGGRGGQGGRHRRSGNESD